MSACNCFSMASKVDQWSEVHVFKESKMWQFCTGRGCFREGTSVPGQPGCRPRRTNILSLFSTSNNTWKYQVMAHFVVVKCFVNKSELGWALSDLWIESLLLSVSKYLQMTIMLPSEEKLYFKSKTSNLTMAGLSKLVFGNVWCNDKSEQE